MKHTIETPSIIRTMTITFQDDYDYCSFIKEIARVANLDKFVGLYHIFKTEHTKIINDEKLYQIYDSFTN